MPESLQQFFAGLTQKAEAELVQALLRLPEERRDWSPSETARTAIDQVAECAVLNGYTAQVLEVRAWPEEGFGTYLPIKAALAAEGTDAVLTELKRNTVRVMGAITALPDDELDREIDTQFGPTKLSAIMCYPYWNMSYHQGQVNYIASILGLLQ